MDEFIMQVMESDMGPCLKVISIIFLLIILFFLAWIGVYDD